MLQEADAIVREEIALAGLEAVAGVCCSSDIRSVGVMRDDTCGPPIIIRAVTSDDMTADWRLYDLLERMSQRIINEVPGINRVAYDHIKASGTIEWGDGHAVDPTDIIS